MAQRAEKGRALGQIDPREEGECRLIIPPARRYGGAGRRSTERSNHRVRVEDRAPVRVGRYVVREDRLEALARSGKDGRSLGA
jgi:hypothetical protein